MDESRLPACVAAQDSCLGSAGRVHVQRNAQGLLRKHATG